MFIRYRTHHASNRQTIEIVVDENQHAQKDRGELCSDTALDMGAGPTPERRGSPCFIHHTDHDPEHYKEHKDSHVIAVRQRTDDSILKYICLLYTSFHQLPLRNTEHNLLRCK